VVPALCLPIEFYTARARARQCSTPEGRGRGASRLPGSIFSLCDRRTWRFWPASRSGSRGRSPVASGAIWALPMWAPGQIEGMRAGGVSAEQATEPHSQRKATAVRSKTQSPAKAAVNHVQRLGKSMSDCSQFSKCCRYKQALTGLILQPRGL
jgi:hypothetical protein